MASIRRSPGGAALDSLRIRWHPRDFPLRSAAEPVLRAAVRELSLEHVVREAWFQGYTVEPFAEKDAA